MIRITDTIVLDDREIKERFVRATGPGGQNINKVSTAVELRVDIAKSSLPSDVKERLIPLAGKRMTTDGVLLIDSRVHRSQAQNRDAARARAKADVKEAAGRGQALSKPPGCRLGIACAMRALGQGAA